jgi:beta-lactamase superfamily II metal-dependent hydrolase
MSKQVQMIFWDVQHGNATYIKTPNGKHLMIDIGVGDYSGHNEKFSPLLALKKNYGVTKLNHVTITHPHLDHFDDILNLEQFSPSTLRTPTYLTDEEIKKDTRSRDRVKVNKFLEFRATYNNHSSSDDSTTEAENYGGVVFERFSTPAMDHNNFNNHSIVTVIGYSGVKIVMPGDNEKASFDELMKSENFKKAIANADILLAPHHGRESAYHAEFVKSVNPRLTIVSDGSLCDTSANHHYSNNSRGWKVFKFDGSSETRKCLTTNSDGEVYVKFGQDTEGRNYLNVEIQ